MSIINTLTAERDKTRCFAYSVYTKQRSDHDNIQIQDQRERNDPNVACGRPPAILFKRRAVLVFVARGGARVQIYASYFLIVQSYIYRIIWNNWSKQNSS